MTKIVFATIALAALCLSFTKEKPFTPPGTVQINDTLFADETEISNFSWQEYEFWNASIYGKNSKEHLATLPDTLVWREKNSHNEPYVQYYYRHPAYKEFPVVGISYEQAVAFCKWRTERVKTHLTSKKDFTSTDRKIGLFTLIATHTQLLIGLILYFISPLGKAAFGQMANAELRLTSLEHPLINIIAIILITIGWSKHKNLITSESKFKTFSIFYGLGLVLILSRLPWSSWF